MKVIYVAGPYRDKRGEWYVHQNIEAAKCVARHLWLMGAAVICPDANTSMFGGTDADDSVWLRGDLEILRRCDAVVVTPDWLKSAGAVGEVHEAAQAGIPAFHYPDDLAAIRRFIEDGTVAEDMRRDVPDDSHSEPPYPTLAPPKEPK